MRCVILGLLFGLVLAAFVATAAQAGPRCAGESYDILTADGGYAPFVTLTAGGRTGAFQLDYGSTGSSLAQDKFRDLATAGASVVDFSLPTFATGRFALVRHGVLRASRGGQAGMVGTDFLSLLTADFVFGADRNATVVLGGRPCQTDILRRRGLVGVRQDGHFSSDAARVRRDRPNVPVVPLRLGDVIVRAQLDTGYEDRVFPPSADINEALYQRLIDGGMLLRRVATLRVATCAGEEQREVYRADDLAAAIIGDDGAVLQPLADLALVRKRRGPCGGIGNMAEPAAQLGASVLWQIGEIVFDPKADMVWLRRQ